MTLPDGRTPSRILHSIVNDPLGEAKDYTYIILGDGPRTGKTWLYNALLQKGFNAFEISEDIAGLVTYQDKKNHVKIDDICKRVTIVLNKRYEPAV